MNAFLVLIMYYFLKYLSLKIMIIKHLILLHFFNHKDLTRQVPYNYIQQAFDSIAGNTVVPYRSLKQFFNYHKLLFFAIYIPFCQIVVKSDFI